MPVTLLFSFIMLWHSKIKIKHNDNLRSCYKFSLFCGKFRFMTTKCVKYLFNLLQSRPSFFCWVRMTHQEQQSLFLFDIQTLVTNILSTVAVTFLFLACCFVSISCWKEFLQTFALAKASIFILSKDLLSLPTQKFSFIRNIFCVMIKIDA